MTTQTQLQEDRADAQAEREEYTWSTVRVAEGIAVNVGSAIVIAILTALVAFLPSTILLLLQRAFNFLAVPTHLLQIIMLIGGSVLLTLLILGLLAFLYVRKHPAMFLLMLLGALIGSYMETSRKFDSWLTKGGMNATQSSGQPRKQPAGSESGSAQGN